LVTEGLLPKRSTPDTLRGPLRTFARVLRTPYTPQARYFGPVGLILASEPDQNGSSQDANHILNGWKVFAPNLILMHAPGNHLTMLRSPNVAGTAKLIQAILGSSCYPSSDIEIIGKL